MTYKVNYTSGKWSINMTFANPQEYQQWLAKVRQFKWTIEAINDDGNAGEARVPKYQAWIASVKEFVRAHGDKSLPPDIKAAVNDVEQGIGAEVTVWDDPPENYETGLLGQHQQE